MDNSFPGSNSAVIQKGKFVFVQAQLQGGAPWGFTLKGGLEHDEPLIISKVEEGGKASLLQHPLQVGDEVVIINEVELSGWRQEAISLIKGLYKTLRLTVRRECCPGPCCSDPRPLSPSRDGRCSGGVKLRIRNRRSEPVSRPHSWHSTKLGEVPQDSDSMMQVTQGGVGAPWHQSYHSSASSTDLSGFESGFLRKSPDQYSSRGSMESLDHTHPAYSSCYQLSSSKSSSSIDHLHSKRDSAYSSFSTSSSIPEYLAAAPSFNKERSYSMENVPQREGMQQADIRYIRMVYDPQQGVSEEHEISSAAIMRSSDSRAQSRSGNVSGQICHRGSSSSGSSGSSGSTSSSQRHSVGPVWNPAHNRHSYENLKGVPAPPLRSDSYAAFRNHERPNSWSSLEHARSQRALHKGSWHHSSGSVATGKSSFGAEGQLHTVIEKSPESSPTTKPKQGFPQAAQPGRLMLPTGIYPVPPPEPHFAQIPTSNPSSGSVYPALAKESKHNHHCDHLGGPVKEDRVTIENGYQSNAPSSNPVQTHVSAQPKLSDRVQDDTQVKPGFYRPHLQPQMQKSQTPYVPQERRDPYTPVQPRGERPRFSLGMEDYDKYRPPQDEELNKCNEQSIHPDPGYTGKISQGQVAQTYRGNFIQTQGSDHIVKPSRYYSDSSALQQKTQDLDHPLTRLENALAEVQRCASPKSTTSFQSERSMSVLEKVSHFERQQGKPRSHSSLSHHGSTARPSQMPRPSSAKSSFSGVEDVCNMLECSSSLVPHGRTQSASSMASYDGHMDVHQDFLTRRGSSDHVQHRQQQEPVVTHKTCLQRSKSTFQLGEGNGKDIHGKGDIHDILGTIQDPSFNRAYRDSIKDAQSKVLRSTSFRRRDLSVNPPPVPAKHMSLERKGTSTSPTPATTSPHTPKERHVVPVEAPSRAPPPELPSVPAVGPPVMRICGRKRFIMVQKKRSYSEPENMHEVGVLTQETNQADRKVQQQFLASEMSVADRRRMFEQVANRNADPRFFSYRPDLKQMQQDALVEYMERKTGRRVDGHSNRPHSAYLQSASSSSADLRSLISTPSMCSLQEPAYDGLTGGIRKASTLPVGMQSPFYPPRGSPNHTQPEVFGQQSQGTNPESHKSGPVLTRHNLPLHLKAAFERATSARSSGRSASAEDLLDRSEERPVPQHFRSKSSPVENFSQDFLARDLQLLRVSSKESSENRVLANTGQKQPSCSARTERSYQLNLDLVQQDAPVLRRERQRHSDRPRAQSASGLAASVGLPCPFTSPGTAASLDWHNGDILCQPNLDSIAFPETGPQSPSGAPGMVRQNSSDTSTSEDTLKDFPCPVATPSPPNPEVTGSQLDSRLQILPKSPVSPTKPLLSLRISESNLQDVQSIAVSQDDDEVFLAPPPPSPPPPPPAPLPIRETEIMQDFPPPPPLTPPVEENVEVSLQHPGPLRPISNCENLTDATAHLEGELLTPSVSPGNTSAASQPQSPVSAPPEQDASEILGADYHLLSRRERTQAELLVETLARELVSHDKSLTSLLDTWAGKTTLDLMEDIFPSHRTISGGSRLSDRAQDGPDTPSQAVPRKMETNLDDEEAYLNQKKVELLQALQVSMRSLQGEREGLSEQQKHFTALGESMEALVQERCKPNEREKYRMFVGDLEKIVNLLLSLSARLARVENALNGLSDDHTAEERESLQLKRKQLCSQQEDARELKENLDRRERVVLDILASYLSGPQLRDYQRYIRIKPALLIRQRYLDELIRQGEEQVQRLEETLPPESRPKNTDPAPQTPHCFNSTHLPRPTTVTSL
ncbi:protein Shroom3 isoform X2 [Sinocyclocheilus anshuiensis]|uniref:protein Shroom3 isoform X2 n=1 Tax=Sinocyclocheilus anshuiensis TaxID=1608454 RepID=UPI0007B96256|nr:PREDICTED: protein Shroom3 isoform X2 [Sinocyclocheilus anshuiensis]